MSEPRRPTVLILDDQEESALALHLNSTYRVVAKVLHPNDVDLDDLRETDLMLVDFQLDHWPERDGLSQLALSPPDGLALACVLRRHSQGQERDSPTAIAILTGKIEKLANPLPYEHREHILADMNNLEWVFQKTPSQEPAPLVTQIVELASAVASLPQRWVSEEARPMSELMRLLGVASDVPDRETLWNEVEACLPPIHELSEWSHGLAVLRWLLHRILPYPCFLWDTYHLAARLTLDHKAFLRALNENAILSDLLGTCRYEGVLESFLGPKWWRSRVESLLWDITDGQSADPSVVRRQFAAKIAAEIPTSEPRVNPLVCVNTDFRPLDQFYSIRESVRIRPDDWPPFADQPWTTIQLARSEPKLNSVVLFEDRSRLE